jgi:hypothetical protein
MDGPRWQWVAELLEANENTAGRASTIGGCSIVSALRVVDEIFGKRGILGSDVTQHPVAQG